MLVSSSIGAEQDFGMPAYPKHRAVVAVLLLVSKRDCLKQAQPY